MRSWGDCELRKAGRLTSVDFSNLLKCTYGFGPVVSAD